MRPQAVQRASRSAESSFSVRLQCSLHLAELVGFKTRKMQAHAQVQIRHLYEARWLSFEVQSRNADSTHVVMISEVAGRDADKESPSLTSTAPSAVLPAAQHGNVLHLVIALVSSFGSRELHLLAMLEAALALVQDQVNKAAGRTVNVRLLTSASLLATDLRRAAHAGVWVLDAQLGRKLCYR